MTQITENNSASSCHPTTHHHKEFRALLQVECHPCNMHHHKQVRLLLPHVFPTTHITTNRSDSWFLMSPLQHTNTSPQTDQTTASSCHPYNTHHHKQVRQPILHVTPTTHITAESSNHCFVSQTTHKHNQKQFRPLTPPACHPLQHTPPKTVQTTDSSRAHHPYTTHHNRQFRPLIPP